jgi:hypothetical protein
VPDGQTRIVGATVGLEEIGEVVGLLDGFDDGNLVGFFLAEDRRKKLNNKKMFIIKTKTNFRKNFETHRVVVVCN